MSKIQRTKHRTTDLFQTHFATTSISASGSTDSAMFEAEGYDKISVVTNVEASSSTTVQICWSIDGVGLHAFETVINSASGSTKVAYVDVKAPYFRIKVINNDTVIHYYNSWVYLKS
jgi:hypothetical protein